MSGASHAVGQTIERHGRHSVRPLTVVMVEPYSQACSRALPLGAKRDVLRQVLRRIEPPRTLFPSLGRMFIRIGRHTEFDICIYIN